MQSSPSLSSSPNSGAVSGAVSGANSGAAPSNRFWMVASVLLFVGIACRQLWLGQASFHPDEAIHTHFSGGFAHYKYNPVFHGPLLYHLVAATFGIFGQNDISARLVPSLLGIGLLALTLGPLRVWTGNRAALASTALLAVSPSVVTYSRRLLHDSLALFLTMGAVLCFLTALENGAATERGRSARIGLFAFLSLFLATKANFFFIAVMLAAFWFAWRFAGVLRLSPSVAKWIPALLFALVAGFSIAFPVPGVNEMRNEKPFWVEDANHRVFKVVAVTLCTAFGLWLLTAPKVIPPQVAVPEAETQAEEPAKSRAKTLTESWTTYFLAAAGALWLYGFLYGQGAQIAMQWAQDHAFPRQTFYDGAASARGALREMLTYWGGQQDKPRLAGRHDYYLVLALLYEVPILVAAMGGIWHASKNRSTFTDLLLWWSFSSWTVYALANEKVPWLLVHSLLPLALLGGVWLGQIRWKRRGLGIAALAGLLFSLRGVSGVGFERGGDHGEPLLYAQTPEVFRDALERTLLQTRGDSRGIFTGGERQWPTVWYLRRNGPNVGESGAAIQGPGVAFPDPNNFRAAVCEEKDWPIFAQAGWQGETVEFFIFPRASWAALAPARYARWFWTRDTVPADERSLPQSSWHTSILAGKGEWSPATVVVGHP